VVPENRPSGWEDCSLAGYGPVGSGECGCTPDVYECGEIGQMSSLVCCCSLKDIGLP
jgi:hypothetical protein